MRRILRRRLNARYCALQKAIEQNHFEKDRKEREARRAQVSSTTAHGHSFQTNVRHAVVRPLFKVISYGSSIRLQEAEQRRKRDEVRRQAKKHAEAGHGRQIVLGQTGVNLTCASACAR
jgi:hypothetical protein